MKRLAVFGIAGGGLGGGAWATTYYAATTGNDSNDGLSVGAAWATL